MDIAKWNDSYKTGHVIVDTQHQELFRMVNELHAAIMEERGKEIVMPTLEKLTGYAIQHFRAEENLMRQAHYPEMDAHRQKHEGLAKEVRNLMGKYKSGRVVLTITLSNFLAKWLQNHIKQDDVALVKFLQGSGNAAAAAAGKL